MRNIKLHSKALFPVGSAILTLVAVGAFSLRNTDAWQWLGEPKTVLIFEGVLGMFVGIAAGWTLRHESSARRLGKEALRDCQARYRMLLDEVQHYAIFTLDPHGMVVSWNSGAERIKGYTAEQRSALFQCAWNAGVRRNPQNRNSVPRTLCGVSLPEIALSRHSNTLIPGLSGRRVLTYNARLDASPRSSVAHIVFAQDRLVT